MTKLFVDKLKGTTLAEDTVNRINMFVDHMAPAESDPDYLRQKLAVLLGIKPNRFHVISRVVEEGSIGLAFYAVSDISAIRLPPHIAKALETAHSNLEMMGISHHVNKGTEQPPKFSGTDGSMNLFIPKDEIDRLEPLFNPDPTVREPAQREFVAKLSASDATMTKQFGLDGV